MKQCKFKVADGWKHDTYYDHVVDIPEGVYFYDIKTLGSGGLVSGCKNYSTVVVTNKHQEWVDQLKDKKLPYVMHTVGEYTIVTIHNVQESTHELPISTEEEVLSGVDFHKYAFACVDNDGRIISVRRIFGYHNIYKVTNYMVTLRDFFSTNEYYSLQNGEGDIRPFIHSEFDITLKEIRTLEGNDAEQMWNDAIYKVANVAYEYNQSKANPEYNFNVEYDAYVSKYGKSKTEILREMKEEWYKQLRDTEE